MALGNSAFADTVCYSAEAKSLVDSLNKNGVATLCVGTDKTPLLNRALGCYESSSGLTIDHMVKDGGLLCVAVSRSKTKTK